MRDTDDYWWKLHPLPGEWFEATWRLPEGSHAGERRFHAAGPFQCDYSDEDAVKGISNRRYVWWFSRKEYRFVRVKTRRQA